MVLRDRPTSPVEYRLPVEATGLPLTETADKRIQWEDSKGEVKASALHHIGGGESKTFPAPALTILENKMEQRRSTSLHIEPKTTSLRGLRNRIASAGLTDLTYRIRLLSNTFGICDE